MLKRYLETFWLAPLAAFLIYGLMILSIFLQLFPAPHYISYLWYAAVFFQVSAVVHQMAHRQYRTSILSIGLLLIPVGCWWFIAIQ